MRNRRERDKLAKGAVDTAKVPRPANQNVNTEDLLALKEKEI